MSESATLVLRLTAPLQAWGTESRFNRRETGPAPSKAGVLGLLAAADGRRRSDPIDDLVELRLGIRVDDPGVLLRDYHTVSDYRGLPLLSAQANSAGRQRATSRAKFTHVTERFYLADALFVVAVGGRHDIIERLAEAVRRPAFPLALGRRACAPTMPLVVSSGTSPVHELDPAAVLARLPWQVSEHRRRLAARRGEAGPSIRLSTVVDAAADDDGAELLPDVPVTFDPRRRASRTRRVVRGSVVVPSGLPNASSMVADPSEHDPFTFLGA